jgi:hypothetical protein
VRSLRAPGIFWPFMGVVTYDSELLAPILKFSGVGTTF